MKKSYLTRFLYFHANTEDSENVWVVFEPWYFFSVTEMYIYISPSPLWAGGGCVGGCVGGGGWGGGVMVSSTQDADAAEIWKPAWWWGTDDRARATCQLYKGLWLAPQIDKNVHTFISDTTMSPSRECHQLTNYLAARAAVECRKNAGDYAASSANSRDERVCTSFRPRWLICPDRA